MLTLLFVALTFVSTFGSYSIDGEACLKTSRNFFNYLYAAYRGELTAEKFKNAVYNYLDEDFMYFYTFQGNAQFNDRDEFLDEDSGLVAVMKSLGPFPAAVAEVASNYWVSDYDSKKNTVEVTVPVRSVFRFPEELPGGVDALKGNDVFRDADFVFKCEISGSYFWRRARIVTFKPTSNSVLKVEPY